MEKKSKKLKTRRSNLQYPALSPQHNLKTRYEEIEDLASYANTLSPEDKAWLNSFAEEEICANFDHKGIKLNDKNDAATRSRIYNRNNERNRCITTIQNAQNKMEYLAEMDLDNETRAIEEDDFE